MRYQIFLQDRPVSPQPDTYWTTRHAAEREAELLEAYYPELVPLVVRAVN